MLTAESRTLTHAGVMTMMAAAIAKAEEIGQPQCIVIVDASGEVLGSIKMMGAKFLSLRSATSKARTAASINGSSDAIPADFGPKIAAATQNQVTNLSGGLPIRVEGFLVGGIGIGSGSGEQDLIVARAALEALGAEAV